MMQKLTLLFLVIFLISSCGQKQAPQEESEPQIIYSNENPYTPESLIEKGHSIDLFKSISGIEPGVTTMEECRKILGDPDYIEQGPDTYLFGIREAGNKLVYYSRFGLMIMAYNNDTENGIVNGILAEAPFDGKTSKGIYIGMPQEELMQIMNENYVMKMNLETSFSYSENEQANDNLQIWLEGGRLSKIKIYGPTAAELNSKISSE